ncbi:MAG: CvpA family protein [Phycisphaerae bacterium]|nr:CvpA family protein [Phycisphaerae bacterium]
MLAELAVILIMLVTVIVVYLKSTLIKSFVILISAVVGLMVAMAFFETLAGFVLGYGFGGEWVLGGVFLLVFAVTFCIFNIAGEQLAPADIYFGDFIDRAARAMVAACAGFIIAGVVLTAAAMMPLGGWPYERFALKKEIKNPSKPDKTLILNADGFVTNFASWLSKGSMSGEKSMAVFHPDFLNEIYLNCIRKDSTNNVLMAGVNAIKVKGAWLIESELISASDNQPIEMPANAKQLIVRAEINGRKIKDGGALPESGKITFTLAQVGLVCKDKDSAGDLKGSSQVIYPLGFIKNANIVEQKGLTEEIAEKARLYDFVFNMPANTAPVMLKFKLNTVDSVGRILSGENIPSPL